MYYMLTRWTGVWCHCGHIRWEYTVHLGNKSSHSNILSIWLYMGHPFRHQVSLVCHHRAQRGHHAPLPMPLTTYKPCQISSISIMSWNATTSVTRNHLWCNWVNLDFYQEAWIAVDLSRFIQFTKNNHARRYIAQCCKCKEMVSIVNTELMIPSNPRNGLSMHRFDDFIKSWKWWYMLLRFQMHELWIHLPIIPHYSLFNWRIIGEFFSFLFQHWLSLHHVNRTLLVQPFRCKMQSWNGCEHEPARYRTRYGELHLISFFKLSCFFLFWNWLYMTIHFVSIWNELISKILSLLEEEKLSQPSWFVKSNIWS